MKMQIIKNVKNLASRFRLRSNCEDPESLNKQGCSLRAKPLVARAEGRHPRCLVFGVPRQRSMVTLGAPTQVFVQQARGLSLGL